MYVAYVSFGCCKSRSGVAYVAMAIHVCCKCMFQMFQTYVLSVLSGYCICCKCMFQMFHLFQVYVTSVSSRCCICFRHMLQASIQNVSSVSDICYKYVLSGCYSCYTHMLQTYVCKYFICFSMLQKCFHVATLAGVGSGRMQMRSPRVRQAKWAYDTVPTCMCVNRHVARNCMRTSTACRCSSCMWNAGAAVQAQQLQTR
jgi:hypothetical protein